MARKTSALHHPSRLHALWVVFLIYAVPPYAWHNMWVHRKYHSWFSYLTWINVAYLLIPSIIYYFVTYPQLIMLSRKPLFPIQFIYFSVFFAFLQIPYGFLLKEEVQKNKKLPKIFLWPTISIFVIDFVATFIVVPVAVPFLNNPLYDLLKTFMK